MDSLAWVALRQAPKKPESAFCFFLLSSFPVAMNCHRIKLVLQINDLLGYCHLHCGSCREWEWASEQVSERV